MIQRQVSDELGNLRANMDDGSNKEGNQLERNYQEFLNSKSRSFYGDMGVDSVIYWVKEIESKCASEHRVNFTTFIFMGRSLLRWSIQVKALGVD